LRTSSVGSEPDKEVVHARKLTESWGEGKPVVPYRNVAKQNMRWEARESKGKVGGQKRRGLATLPDHIALETAYKQCISQKKSRKSQTS